MFKSSKKYRSSQNVLGLTVTDRPAWGTGPSIPELAILGWHMYVDMYVESRRERGTRCTGMRGPKEQTRGAILGLGI